MLDGSRFAGGVVDLVAAARLILPDGHSLVGAGWRDSVGSGAVLRRDGTVAMSMLVMFAALAIQTTPLADPASAEAAAVMVPVNGVFAALAARDAAMLAPHLDAEARMIVVVERPGGTPVVRALSGQDFASGLQPGTERFEEIMPDPIVAIDGDIAMVWGRYVFKVDGTLSHCGTDHFDLVRRDGVWKIAGITWNQRMAGCEG